MNCLDLTILHFKYIQSAFLILLWPLFPAQKFRKWKHIFSNNIFIKYYIVIERHENKLNFLQRLYILEMHLKNNIEYDINERKLYLLLDVEVQVVGLHVNVQVIEELVVAWFDFWHCQSKNKSGFKYCSYNF